MSNIIVKPGDKIAFKKDYPYCTRNEFLNIGSIQQGGICIDERWVDNVSDSELEEMYEVVKSLNLTKEIDGEEYFFVPANIPIEVVNTFDTEDTCILRIMNKVEVHYLASAFVLDNPNYNIDEVQIRFVL